MRIFVSSWLLVLLSISLVSAEPRERSTEYEQYEKYGSRLAYARYQMLRLKNKDDSRDYWYDQSGYSLYSDVYGGFYSPRYRRRGELDIYTGRRAVEASLGEGIQTTRDPKDERSLSISEVVPVTVRSHPWADMLKESKSGPELSSLFRLAPRDCFVVYFKNGTTIGDLENGLQSLVEGADSLFNFQQSLSATEKIAQRLGVADFRELESLMGETLFISEDLDFFPNTHYALVFKGDSFSKLGAGLLLKSEAQGRVGDAYVLASSQAFFDRIKAAADGKVETLADADDLKYANVVLDNPRDGFCYLSEAFISKMVFPAHRINAARRHAAIKELETRQYSVLAYRTITDAWPTSFEQMVREEYLPPNPDDGDYIIGKDGVVEHKVWGSLWNIKALSEVPIQRVSPSEKAGYDSFRESYDRLWTRFFDPVGLAFTVGEELRFHTIILPLVNSREYNLLQLFCGGEPRQLKTLTYPYLASPASFHSKLNSDDILLFFGNNWSVVEDGERDRIREKMNRELRKKEGFPEDFDLFDVFGKEICVSYGPDMRFSGWEHLDLVVSLELKDAEAFRTLTGKLIGFVNLKRSEKELHGVTYVELRDRNSEPALYAVYDKEFVHLTIYQPALERLCLKLKEQPDQAGWFDSDWVGSSQNVIFRADLRQSESLLADSLDPGRTHSGRTQMRHAVGYMTDYMLLEKALGKDQAERFFRYVPQSLYGVPLSVREGRVYLGERPAEEISMSGSVFYSKGNSGADEGLGLEELIQKHRDPAAIAKMKLFEEASVGMSFTPEGLSTRVSINNPNYKVEAAVSGGGHSFALWAGGVGVVLLGGWMALRRTKPHPIQDVVR
jgi:hypothetical protein